MWVQRRTKEDCFILYLSKLVSAKLSRRKGKIRKCECSTFNSLQTAVNCSLTACYCSRWPEKRTIAMDFSPLSDALASNSYDKIADICDEIMLQVAAEGVAFQEDWPYAIHLLGHIYAGDTNNMRFLWKSMPTAVKENQLEVQAAWKIGQKLWARDYGGVYQAIREFDWSQEAQGLVAAFSDLYTKKMFQLMQSAYSTISVQDTALFLGMSEDDTTSYVQQQGWILDPASQMITVKKQPIITEQKLDPCKLQSLTEYVFHLEH